MSDCENAHFREIDLPQLYIPEDLEHLATSDSESGTATTPSLASPPTTHGTPMSQLGGAISSFGFSNYDESPPSPSTTPKSRKKRYPQRFPSKHRGLFRTPSKVKPKRLRVSTHSSEILAGCTFPAQPQAYDVLLEEGGKVVTKSLYVPHGAQIMNMEILSCVFQLFGCCKPGCRGSLQLHKYPFIDGLQSYFVVHCDRCHCVVAKFSSSLHLDESPKQAVNNPKMFSHRACEVNVRALLALHTTSLSLLDFKLACSLLDLPVPKRDLNKRSIERFSQVTSKICGISMDLAAEEVRNRLDSEPSVIEGATRCHVSYDASWHRRGHYSNQGFGAAIDSTSGKVLDFGVMQRVCRKCSFWPEERQTSFPEDYAVFIENHADCTINFTGTSQAMEGAIAVDLWNRSIPRNQLVYSTYIGDGDSSSFKRVVESKPYGSREVVRKEECLGHVQKRLKKNLVKKSKTSPGIPKSKVEKIGQLYALVVVQNRGKQPEDICQALRTMLGHLGEDHSNCPERTNSWCYFARGQAELAIDPELTLPKRRIPYCNQVELARLEEVFGNFASRDMCGALTMGKTQNANESLHSVVWHNSPKGKYVGQKSLYCSSALAVTSFNEGSLCFAAVLNEYGIRASASTLYHLARRDKTRIYMRERAITQTQRRRRRQLKVRSHTAETSRQRREKSASKYSSGKFGTELAPIATSSVSKDPDSGDESDTTCSKCEQRNCPIGRRKKVQDWIGCDLCDRWFHGNCVGVKKVSDFSDTPYFCEDCEDSS